LKSRKDIRFLLLIFCCSMGLLLQPVTGDLLAAGVTRITVSPSTSLDGDSVYLKNIASITGDDPLLADRLGSIYIGRAPLPGNTLEFEPADLHRRLKQNGFDPADLELQVPPKVVVERGSVTVSREKMQRLVSDYLTKNLLAGMPDASIQEIHVAEPVELPAGRITYTVNPARNAESMGKIPFTINFDINGKFYKRVWATATVEVISDVVVAKKPHKMDLADLPSDVIRDPEEVLGKRTSRAISAQTVLRPNLVELPPVVKRGDMVVIVAESEGLKVTALGEVKKKGRIGERIPVINSDSRKILYARVVDGNTVKIEF
jgi:flagella basal body P-ring formation protein FlgA